VVQAFVDPDNTRSHRLLVIAADGGIVPRLKTGIARREGS
jgi:hypothetical protein